MRMKTLKLWCSVMMVIAIVCYGCDTIIPDNDEEMSVALNKNSLQLEIYGTDSLWYTINPSDYIPNSVLWECLDTSIAAVSQTGVVLGKAIGTTHIRLTIDTLVALCELYITDCDTIHYSQLSETHYPPCDRWLITGDINMETDLSGLCDALNGAERPIDLVFVGAKGIGSTQLKKNQYIKSVIADSVTSVGSKAFSECIALISVSFANVNSLSIRAFEKCSSLREIEMPSLRGIGGDEVFAYCTSLDTIDFPNLEHINGSGVFSYCDNIETIELPNLIKIGTSTFSYCKSLKVVNLQNVETISYLSFALCTQLKSVTFPKAHTLYGQIFAGCAALESVELGSNNPSQELDVKMVSVFSQSPMSNIHFIMSEAEFEAHCTTDNLWRGMGPFKFFTPIRQI